MAKNHEEMYTILDLNACILHSYYGAIDDEPIQGEIKEEIKNAHCGFNAFLDLYIKPILEDYQPRQILCVIDRGTDYQKELYPEYKQERAEKKTERDPLEVAEIEKLKDWTKRFMLQIGSTILGVKGVEADDCIGYLCTNLPGYKRVHSVDSDFVQLLTDSDIDLYLKGDMVDASLGGHKVADSNEEVPFSIWPLFRSLIGKKSDGYGGVKGVGKAAWTKMLISAGVDGLEKFQELAYAKQWGQLSALAKMTGIDPKLMDKLEDQRLEWEVALQLASLHGDLCWKPRNRKIPKLDQIRRVGNQAEFAKVMRVASSEDRIHEFSDYLPTEWLIDANNFEESDIEEFRQELLETPHVSFDYESWSPYQDHQPFLDAAKGKNYVDVLSQKISGVSFNFGANLQYTFYLTVDHADSANLPLEVIGKFLDVIPEDKVVVAQNCQFEKVLTKTNLGREIEDMHDTKLMQVYTDEDGETGLKSQSKNHLNYNQTSYMEVTDGKPMNEIPAARVVGYGCDDSTVTGRLYDRHKLIMLLEGTWEGYIEREPMADDVLTHSFIKGNKIDWPFMQEMHRRDEEEFTEQHMEVHRLMKEQDLQPSKQRAMEFFKADEDYHRKDMREKFKEGKATSTCLPDGKDIAELTFADYWVYWKAWKLDQFTQKTAYTPFKTRIEKKEFVPTKTSLFRLMEKLGFDSTPQSYSIRSIKAWAEAHLELDWDSGEDKTPHADFVKALIGASKNIVKASERTGESYETLIKVCNKFQGDEDNSKVITEGDELSVGSPPQIQELLYLKLGLPVRLHSMPQRGSKRDGFSVEGAPSSNELAIRWALAEDMDGPDDWRIPVLKAFMEAKTIRTQIGLFDIPYPLWRHPDTDLIHPSIINCGAPATKRLSGSSPNVMQVSGKTDMREAYLPLEDDHVVIGIDWAGQELRLTAGECQDPAMLSAYVGKADELRDLHSLTGAGIAGMEYSAFYKAYQDEGDPQHGPVVKVRKSAKMVNFGIVYGISALALAQKLIIPQIEADKMLSNTFATYPGMEQWQKGTVTFAKQHGYVQTFFGTRKHAHSDLFSSDKGRARRVERQLINYKIQGGAADQIKRTFTMAWKTRIIQDLDVGFMIPIHDEVFASVPRKHALEYIQRMSAIMKMPVPGCVVPMDVDVAISSMSWGHMKEIGANPSQLDIDNALAREDQEAA